MDNAARMLKTLGHPLRIRIVTGLADRESSCVNEIRQYLGVPQAVVSQHLKLLKGAGILDASREGARVVYWVRDGVARELIQVIRGG